ERDSGSVAAALHGRRSGAGGRGAATGACSSSGAATTSARRLTTLGERKAGVRWVMPSAQLRDSSTRRDTRRQEEEGGQCASWAPSSQRLLRPGDPKAALDVAVLRRLVHRTAARRALSPCAASCRLLLCLVPRPDARPASGRASEFAWSDV